MKSLNLRCYSLLWATGKDVELKNSICTIPMRTIVENITASCSKISLWLLIGAVSILPFLWLKQGPLEIKVCFNWWKKEAERATQTSKARFYVSDYLQKFMIYFWAAEAQKWKTKKNSEYVYGYQESDMCWKTCIYNTPPGIAENNVYLLKAGNVWTHMKKIFTGLSTEFGALPV